MRKVIILSICCLLLLSGCAHTLDVINFYFSGPPIWVEDPNSYTSDENVITYLAGPCKSIIDARNDAYNGLANLIICDIDSKLEFGKMISSDFNTREISTTLKSSQKSSSAVTLVGVVEVNRWKNPITDDIYIRYEISKRDYQESQGATEDKIQQLIEIDSKLKKAVINLVNNPSKSFIKQLYNSFDLYTSILNREWNVPLYVEIDSQLNKADMFLLQYIKRLFASVSIKLVTNDNYCEDTEVKELKFEIISENFDDFSQIKFYLENEISKNKYIANSNKDGFFSFYIPSSDLHIGTNNFKCSFYGLEVVSIIKNIVLPFKNVELNVIHTPQTPSGLKLSLSKPPWIFVDLTWNSVDDASYYNIYRKEVSLDTDNYTKIAKTNDNKYKDKNIDDDKIYLYRVTSVNNLSETESNVSNIKTLRTVKKPILDLNISKKEALGCEEIIFRWNDIEEFRLIDAKFKLQLIKDNKVCYAINNIPNLFEYRWKVPFDIERGNYFVKIIEENTKLSNTIMPSVHLSGSHKHDGNKNIKIGILELNDSFVDSGWICNEQILDQYQLQVNPFLFSHSFNISVQPLNDQLDIGFKIVDIDSGEIKYEINNNKKGISEVRTVSLRNGIYLIKIFYINGEGGMYMINCERIS